MQILPFIKRLNFQFSELAIDELSAFQDQLWIDRSGRDRLFTEQLQSVIDRLRVFPESGETRPELGTEIRAVPLWRYLIFYRLAEDVLIIEHVIQGGSRYRGADLKGQWRGLPTALSPIQLHPDGVNAPNNCCLTS